MANNCVDKQFWGDQTELRLGYDDAQGHNTIYRDKTDSTPVYVRNDTANPKDNPSGTKMDVKVMCDGNCYTCGDPYARCWPACEQCPRGQNTVRSTVWENGKRRCQLRICSGEKGRVLTPHGVWSPDSAGTYRVANYY